MKNKNPSIESLERKYRRHEVSFSQIEQTTGQDIENVIANHGHYSVSAEDEWQKNNSQSFCQILEIYKTLI